MKPAPAADGRAQSSPPSNAAKPAPAAAAPAADPIAPGEVDHRDWIDRKATAQALRASQARQTSGRRRLVDPATCDRDYSPQEWEFMQAMQDYKQRSGRNFPTWSEVLEVLRALGYEKAAEPLAAAPEPRPKAADRSRRAASA